MDMDDDSAYEPTENGSQVGDAAELEDSDAAALGADNGQLQIVAAAPACGLCSEDTIRKVLSDVCSTMTKPAWHDTICSHMASLGTYTETPNCIDKLASEVFNPSYRYCNNVLLAEKTGCNRRELPDYMQLLGSAFLETQRAQRRILEQRLVDTYPEADLMAAASLRGH